ncbi:MAG: FAD-dependent oxidoreductase [Cyanobacteriota bacterium]|nr:FAD-dependent oxidoreductase [Cyanobacteriota bacterium]
MWLPELGLAIGIEQGSYLGDQPGVAIFGMARGGNAGSDCPAATQASRPKSTFTPSLYMGSLPTVVLAGCGYGAIATMEALADQAHLIAINPYPYLVNSGMTTRLLSGRFSADLVRIPMQGHFSRYGVRFLAGQVIQIDPYQQTVTLQQEGGRQTLIYDRLLLNMGRRVVSSVGEFAGAFRVRPMEALLAAHQHICRCWQQAAAGDATPGLLTFVVVGGGCTGVELMGELVDLCRDLSQATGIPFAQARLLLVSRSAHLAEGISERFSRLVEGSLRQQGVEILLHTSVEGILPDQVGLKTHSIPCRTTLWAGGLTASPVLAESGLPLGSQGGVQVDPTFQVVGFPTIFAMGDCADFLLAQPIAHCPAEPGLLPKLGVFAVRAAPVVAHNLRSSLHGQPLASFRPQRSVFISVTVGNRQAVMQKGSLLWRGYGATVLKNWFDWRYMRRYKPVKWQDFMY